MAAATHPPTRTPHLLIALIVGALTGIVAAFIWAAMWTVIIPWERRIAFTTTAFLFGGFGGVMFAAKTMLR